MRCFYRPRALRSVNRFTQARPFVRICAARGHVWRQGRRATAPGASLAAVARRCRGRRHCRRAGDTLAAIAGGKPSPEGDGHRAGLGPGAGDSPSSGEGGTDVAGRAHARAATERRGPLPPWRTGGPWTRRGVRIRPRRPNASVSLFRSPPVRPLRWGGAGAAVRTLRSRAARTRRRRAGRRRGRRLEDRTRSWRGSGRLAAMTLTLPVPSGPICDPLHAPASPTGPVPPVSGDRRAVPRG